MVAAGEASGVASEATRELTLIFSEVVTYTYIHLRY